MARNLVETLSKTVSTTASSVVQASDAPPTAALTATPNAGIGPLDVTADASASDHDDTPIATYRFDFGDGATTGTGFDADDVSIVRG